MHDSRDIDTGRHAIERGWLTAAMVARVLREPDVSRLGFLPTARRLGLLNAAQCIELGADAPEPVKPPQQLTAGDVVDGRRILRPLGAGGMGTVFLADDQGREVAMKFLVALGDEDLARFDREARAAIAVDGHPAIVRIHSIGRYGRHPYLILDYIAGHALDSELADGPLELVRALRITATIAEAVEAVHAAGLLHRDLKPANVLIRELDDAPFLTDFGLARRLAGDTVTNTGEVMGTPEFMSPEQIKGETIDRGTDVWALGVLLFQLVTGRMPFQGDSFHATARLITGSTAPPVTSLNPSLPPALAGIIGRALRRRPQDRFASAGALAAACRALAESEAVARSADSGIDEARRRSARRRALARQAAVGLGALGLVAGLAFGLSRLRGETAGSPARLAAEQRLRRSLPSPDQLLATLGRRMIAEARPGVAALAAPDERETRRSGDAVRALERLTEALAGEPVPDDLARLHALAWLDRHIAFPDAPPGPATTAPADPAPALLEAWRTRREAPLPATAALLAISRGASPCAPAAAVAAATLLLERGDWRAALDALTALPDEPLAGSLLEPARRLLVEDAIRLALALADDDRHGARTLAAALAAGHGSPLFPEGRLATIWTAALKARWTSLAETESLIRLDRLHRRLATVAAEALLDTPPRSEALQLLDEARAARADNRLVDSYRIYARLNATDPRVQLPPDFPVAALDRALSISAGRGEGFRTSADDSRRRRLDLGLQGSRLGIYLSVLPEQFLRELHTQRAFDPRLKRDPDDPFLLFWSATANIGAPSSAVRRDPQAAADFRASCAEIRSRLDRALTSPLLTPPFRSAAQFLLARVTFRRCQLEAIAMKPRATMADVRRVLARARPEIGERLAEFARGVPPLPENGPKLLVDVDFILGRYEAVLGHVEDYIEALQKRLQLSQSGVHLPDRPAAYPRLPISPRNEQSARAWGHIRAGRALEQLERTPEAEPRYREAFRLRPESAILRELAEFFLRCDKLDEVQRLLDEAPWNDGHIKHLRRQLARARGARRR